MDGDQEDQLGDVTTASLGNSLTDSAQFDLLTGRLQSAQVAQSTTPVVQESYGTTSWAASPRAASSGEAEAASRDFRKR